MNSRFLAFIMTDERSDAKQVSRLISEAGDVFAKNFPKTTCFERAIFYSWYCSIQDCAFCYMSSKHIAKKAVRSKESLIAEALICKNLGWKLGFFSGGLQAFPKDRLLDIISSLSIVMDDKLWLNIGPLDEDDIRLFLPYAKGLVASIECLEPGLHKKICPSKPMLPYENMLKLAKKYDIGRAMTMIIGLGEKEDDFSLLQNFIAEYGITKIHFYGLNPQKGTLFQDSSPPTKEQQAYWIARTRIAFPKIDIQCGIWLERIDYLGLLLGAGSNSVSKFPMMKKFGSRYCREILTQSEKAGRTFEGNITDIDKALSIDWDSQISSLPFKDEEKARIKVKLDLYLKGFRKNL